MKQRFNYIGVHKNIMREREAIAVTEQGARALTSALEDAKLRFKHRQEITGGKPHEK